MKMPILVNEHGDIISFSSVAEAESYMEAIDVESGEYIVTDADGARLTVDVVTVEVPLLWGLWKGRVKKLRITEGVARLGRWGVLLTVTTRSASPAYLRAYDLGAIVAAESWYSDMRAMAEDDKETFSR